MLSPLPFVGTCVSGRDGNADSLTEPALARLAALLLPKSRQLACLPMRVPNWMARLTRDAARGSPSCLKPSLNTILSPVPAYGRSLFICQDPDFMRPAANCDEHGTSW